MTSYAEARIHFLFCRGQRKTGKEAKNLWRYHDQEIVALIATLANGYAPTALSQQCAMMAAPSPVGWTPSAAHNAGGAIFEAASNIV